MSTSSTIASSKKDWDVFELMLEGYKTLLVNKQLSTDLFVGFASFRLTLKNMFPFRIGSIFLDLKKKNSLDMLLENT